MDKQSLDYYIENQQDVFTQLSDQIWQYAEMRFQEYRSAALLAEFLQKEGFTVQKGIANIPTAFVASYGEGKPVIALLGEFDALAGLSQTAGVAVKETQTPGKSGHGCGHNLLGTGALAAAVAVKKLMEKSDIKGTLRFYGCPGEEGGSGKTFMAREGIFDDVDAALTWHPFGVNAVMSAATLANFQVYFRFHGRSAHAAAAPHLGRSALDAVELMNIGVNYLREHIISDARVHYAVTNTGGSSPNVVQAEAEVLYLIRAPQLSQVSEIYQRICDIAKGAALMTGTECEIVFDKACSNCIPNETLERLLYDEFSQVGAPKFCAEEKQFCRQIRNTLKPTDIENDLNMANGFMGGRNKDIIEKLKAQEASEILLPYAHDAILLPGSTDVGDVSWIVPTAQIAVACQAFGTPGHSWQLVSQAATSVAHKGMMVAAKVLARAAVQILCRPEFAEQAQQELRGKLGDIRYCCPIPPEVQPKPAKK